MSPRCQSCANGGNNDASPPYSEILPLHNNPSTHIHLNCTQHGHQPEDTAEPTRSDDNIELTKREKELIDAAIAGKTGPAACACFLALISVAMLVGVMFMAMSIKETLDGEKQDAWKGVTTAATLTMYDSYPTSILGSK